MSNKLAQEKSPYLRQHADNPVNWYPWGEEAFALARTEDKPIFLSIGYSTCHWCHVMAEESFADREVAKLLNDNFISIKVDREERPDIDTVYMTVCRSLTGSGGWPLTIIMTPEQKPFFAATYLPKHSQGRIIGMMELLPELTRAWKSRREELASTAEQISSFLQGLISESATDTDLPQPILLDQAVNVLEADFDNENGGFGKGLKFPMPHNLLFLLRKYALSADKKALHMAEKTLIQMYRGGIYDHIDGGFSRYSTDPYWYLPHFEKMLYDNALLSLAYAEAYSLTKRPLYAQIAKDIYNFVLRELRSPEGGFYSALDADSKSREGGYYLLDKKDLVRALGEEDAAKFSQNYGLCDESQVPNLLDNADYEQRAQADMAIREKLSAYRQNRTRLRRDEKIITSWNGLMIASLARASFLMEDGELLAAAQRAEKFLREHLLKSNGRLYLRYCEQEAANSGILDDYAAYAWALVELYAVTFNADYLQQALSLVEQVSRRFHDPEGGYFLTDKEAEALIARPKETYDSALPSGNSLIALTLIRLAHLTGKKEIRQEAEEQLRYLWGSIGDYPQGGGFTLFACTEEIYPASELICAGIKPDSTARLLDILRQRNLSNLRVLVLNQDNASLLHELAPFTADYPEAPPKPLFYFCHNQRCEQPVSSWDELETLLNGNI